MLILYSCDTGTEPDYTKADFDFTIISPVNDNTVSDSIKTIYDEDAALLAVREIWNSKSSDSARVEIPQDIKQTLYYALISIYKSGFAARDSVVEMYPIHAFIGRAQHEIIVGIDTTQEWVSAWRRGERLTENAEIDRLMELYDLELVKSPFGWSCCTHALLHTDRQLNLKALTKLFEKINGVRYAEENGYFGGNHFLFATDMKGYWEFSFTFGWGDCPSGCISKHTWKFKVLPDGVVEYAGSSGTPIP